MTHVETRTQPGPSRGQMLCSFARYANLSKRPRVLPLTQGPWLLPGGPGPLCCFLLLLIPLRVAPEPDVLNPGTQQDHPGGFLKILLPWLIPDKLTASLWDGLLHLD